MRKTLGVLLVGIVLVSVADYVVSQDGKEKGTLKEASDAQVSQEDEKPKETPEKPMSFWMEKKLDYSKSILESLAKGEFDTLSEDAEQMRLIGKLEGFVRRKSPDYRAQLQTFEMANQELIRQSKRENAEGAALAFNQLTTSCVACHVLLREGVE